MEMESRPQSYRAVVDTLAARKLSLPEDRWDELFEVAEAQRVLPFMASCLAPESANLPRPVQERLTALAREHRRTAFWFSAELNALLSAFAAAAVDVVPLKGPCFAQRVYGGAHLRAVRDLDILVRRKQLVSARHLLTELGFQVHRTNCDYHEVWARGTMAVELHWDVAEKVLFNFDVDSAWKLAVRGSFNGHPVLCLHPMDELLFICLHGTRHCFENLGLVLDVALMLDHLAANGDRDSLVLRAEVQDLTGVLLLGCELAQNLRPGKPLPFAISWQAGDYSHLRKMAEEHWQLLSIGSATPMRWRTVRRFSRQTIRTRHGRMLRVMRDAADAFHVATQGPEEWAEKIGTDYKLSWLIHVLRSLPVRSSGGK
jgi:hypothetical protein